RHGDGACGGSFEERDPEALHLPGLLVRLGEETEEVRRSKRRPLPGLGHGAQEARSLLEVPAHSERSKPLLVRPGAEDDRAQPWRRSTQTKPALDSLCRYEPTDEGDAGLGG